MKQLLDKGAQRNMELIQQRWDEYDQDHLSDST